MKRIITAVLAVFITANAYSQNIISAREAGMGSASAITDGGPAAVFSNPAALALADTAGPHFFFNFETGGFARGVYSAAASFQHDNLGYAAVGYTYADMNEGQADSYFPYAVHLVSFAAVSYSNRLFYNFTYGATFKGYFDYDGGASLYEYGVDAGFTYQPLLDMEFFVAGAARNLLFGVYKGGEADRELSPGYTLGVSLLLLDGVLNLKYDAVKNQSEPRYISRAGVEIKIFDAFYLRGGTDDLNPSAGAGFVYQGAAFDYAVRFYNGSAAHTLSLNLSWQVEK